MKLTVNGAPERAMKIGSSDQLPRMAFPILSGVRCRNVVADGATESVSDIEVEGPRSVRGSILSAGVFRLKESFEVISIEFAQV